MFGLLTIVIATIVLVVIVAVTIAIVFAQTAYISKPRPCHDPNCPGTHYQCLECGIVSHSPGLCQQKLTYMFGGYEYGEVVPLAYNNNTQTVCEGETIHVKWNEEKQNWITV